MASSQTITGFTVHFWDSQIHVNYPNFRMHKLHDYINRWSASSDTDCHRLPSGLIGWMAQGITHHLGGALIKLANKISSGDFRLPCGPVVYSKSSTCAGVDGRRFEATTELTDEARGVLPPPCVSNLE